MDYYFFQMVLPSPGPYCYPIGWGGVQLIVHSASVRSPPLAAATRLGRLAVCHEFLPFPSTFRFEWYISSQDMGAETPCSVFKGTG